MEVSTFPYRSCSSPQLWPGHHCLPPAPPHQTPEAPGWGNWEAPSPKPDIARDLTKGPGFGGHHSRVVACLSLYKYLFTLERIKTKAASVILWHYYKFCIVSAGVKGHHCQDTTTPDSSRHRLALLPTCMFVPPLPPAALMPPQGQEQCPVITAASEG